jgi:hypothetical protein
VNYANVYEVWRQARAFVVDDYVCGDFSVPSAEDLEDAIAAEAEGHTADWEPYVSFCIYGEHGLKREYFLSREEIESGEAYKGGMRVVYCDGKPLTIIPLVEAPAESNVTA